MAVLAHLSDLHVDGGPRAAERAERVLSFLDGLRQPVDAVRELPGLRVAWETTVVLDADLSPALACHVLDGDGRLTTHVGFVPREA